jgi:hypothetical protein
MVTFTRTVTVAAGAFAPGHLGELTQFAPFELVDDVLAGTGAVQRRLRVLPSRVGVYFLLALGLFPGLGYRQVWAKLTAGLDGLAGLAVAAPSEKALRDLRRRLGPAPLKALFEVLAGPLAWPYAPGVRFGGLRTVAFDGCSSIRVPDTARNRAWPGRIRHKAGFAGYPLVHLMTLAETGTRALLGAVIGCAADGDEPALARGLLPLLGPGMLVLADRAFDTGAFLAAAAGTGADFLVRARATRSPRVTQVLPDGSWLAEIGGLRVRVIEAAVTVTGADGTRWSDRYRLITTLTDHRRYPAHRLARLYHERWEIEMVFTQLAKRAVQPVGGGREHVADLDLVVGDDHAVDEQLGQLAPLLEAGGGEAGPDGLAECLDTVGDSLQFQLLPGGGVQLVLLGEQGGVPAVQVLAFALEFGQPEDLGEVGVQQPLLLALELAQGLADG